MFGKKSNAVDAGWNDETGGFDDNQNKSPPRKPPINNRPSNTGVFQAYQHKPVHKNIQRPEVQNHRQAFKKPGKSKSLKFKNYMRETGQIPWQTNAIDRRHNNRADLKSEKTSQTPRQTNAIDRRHNNRADLKSESQEKIIRPMSFQRMKELVTKPPNEVLLTFCNNESGLSLIFEEEVIRRDIMAYFLLALGKTVLSSLPNNVNNILTTISSKKRFFLMQIPSYLASFHKKDKNEEYHLNSIDSLCDFLLKFQKTLHHTASEILIMLLPLLSKTCNSTFPENGAIQSMVLTKLKKLEEDNQHFLQNYTPKEIKQKSEKEKLQLQDPPEDFRQIPVLPTSDDIHMPCSFLRPNLVQGSYNGAEHYLDVQYRLLREDYVRPLRDGIFEYLCQVENNKVIKGLKSARLYTDVQIVEQDFVKGGLVHIALFDVKKFSKIKWEFSKRFLTGSLLCLSDDNFETMFFASVAIREPKELSNGKLVLRFEELTDEVLNMSPLRNFVVIETTAYFEAYRHNLSALRGLDEDHLPLKSYIVNVQKEVGKPKYLKETIAYDMRPLLLPFNENYIKRSVVRGNIVTSYEFPTSISSKAVSIPVLKGESWPSCSELNLDPSQYEAIKAAITKEFTVIQGPPGTGKTFVGLRIAQLLLHNLSKWQPSGQSSPILVVCYTNHALDQFLEGLLLFTENIVRVGGRGSNEALSKYQLNNLKKEMSQKRKVPSFIFKSIKQKNYEVKLLNKKIDKFKSLIKKSYACVLDEYELRNYIKPQHFTSLLRLGIKSVMIYWLSDNVGPEEEFNAVESQIKRMHPPEMVAMPNNVSLQNTVYGNNARPAAAEVVEEEVYSEGEADIEYIENQRALDTEEFAGVSFDVPQFRNRIEIAIKKDTDGWQVQGGLKERKKLLKKYLYTSKAMSESEATSIKDVWRLNMKDRWRLYKFWAEKFVEDQSESILGLQQKLRKEFLELQEMRSQEDLHVCRQAQVVGMTTTGAAKYRNILKDLNPKIVIVEEAAEILECHIVTSLAPGTEHVILIGDHQQLRPSPTVHALAVEYDLNVSLFERMLNNGMECYRLGIQHRMRPEIASLLVPHIYKELRNHESVTKFENIRGISKNVYFVNHDISEQQERDSKSKENLHEAKFLMRLCSYILLQGYDPSQITVLTTYSGQLFVLKKLKGNGILQGIRVTVVDNYQGEENDIILISFVRSNVEGNIGFLKISNRVCVALSRARKGLFCIGNFELLAEKSNLWKNIVGTLSMNRAIGPSLQLMCQNHPEVSNVVACDKDFDSVPEGGCTRNCEFRLTCGHVCSLLCHPYDLEHVNIRCQKDCSKKCLYGHPCKRKCFQKCGPCIVLVDQKIPSCGHTIRLQCNKQDKIVCTFPCEKLLKCGHECKTSCGSPCTLRCLKVISVKSPKCGHTVRIPCCDSEDEERLIEKCKHPCSAELSCGHLCKGDCRSCHQRHIVCNQPCERALVCGHECNNSCVSPCTLRCLKVISVKSPKCGHTVRIPCCDSEDEERLIEKCQHPCSAELSCGHLCKGDCRSCHQRHIVCNQPCERALVCGHECNNSCGSPCTLRCLKVISVKSPKCGHTVRKLCCDSEDEERLIEKCKHPCSVELSCGHMCKGNCRSCHQGRLHVACNQPCKRVLVCGHKCNNSCRASCSLRCRKIILVKSPKCGHTVRIPCCDSQIKEKLIDNCKHYCFAELSCGHMCIGNCSSCHQGRLHVACNQPCKRVLVCGHECKSRCSRSCPPCKQCAKKELLTKLNF